MLEREHPLLRSIFEDEGDLPVQLGREVSFV